MRVCPLLHCFSFAFAFSFLILPIILRCLFYFYQNSFINKTESIGKMWIPIGNCQSRASTLNWYSQARVATCKSWFWLRIWGIPWNLKTPNVNNTRWRRLNFYDANLLARGRTVRGTHYEMQILKLWFDPRWRISQNFCGRFVLIFKLLSHPVKCLQCLPP